MSDNEGGERAPKDIRSRIAAFENVSDAATAASRPRPPPAVLAKKPVISNTAASSDPLLRPSPSPPPPPVVVRPKLPSPSPSGSGELSPSSDRPARSSAGVGAVGLPGLTKTGTATRKVPPPAIPPKPTIAVGPAETTRDPLVPLGGGTDAASTSSVSSARSSQLEQPLVPKRSTSPKSIDQPLPSASSKPAAPAAPPGIPPRLPTRKPTADTSSNSGTVAAPILPDRDASSSSSAGPKPILPPRKAGSSSSAVSSRTQKDPFTSDLDPFASQADPFGDETKASTRSKGAFEDDFAPPARSATLSSTRPSQASTFDRPPVRPPSTSVSSRPSTSSAAIMKPPSRSSTLQAEHRSTAHRSTVSGTSGGGGGGGGVTSFSDFPSQFQGFSSKYLDFSSTSAAKRGYAPPPEANKPTPAPVSGSSLSTFGTRAPLVKTDINGSQAASKTGMSTPYLLRKYTEVWDGLVDAVEPEVPYGRDPRIYGRLENVLVREMWLNSQLDEKALKRIWNECDPDKLGSLDREGFCKGMWMIDEELKRQGRR